MGEITENICGERRKRIDEMLGVHDKRLNNHSDRIDKLEQYQSRTEAKIENLCEQIKSLVTTMRWFIGLLIGAFVSFFFYVIQNRIVR